MPQPDYFAGLQARKARATRVIQEIAYERLKLTRQVEAAQKRMAEIDEIVADQETIILATERAQQEFTAWLAVKEKAVTLSQIKQGIQAANGAVNEEGQNNA